MNYVHHIQFLYSGLYNCNNFFAYIGHTLRTCIIILVVASLSDEFMLKITSHVFMNFEKIELF